MSKANYKYYEAKLVVGGKQAFQQFRAVSFEDAKMQAQELANRWALSVKSVTGELPSAHVLSVQTWTL